MVYHIQPCQYNNGTKTCDLCLTEKLTIINANKRKLLNKRPELISKCRYEKFYSANHTNDITYDLPRLLST